MVEAGAVWVRWVAEAEGFHRLLPWAAPMATALDVWDRSAVQGPRVRPRLRAPGAVREADSTLVPLGHWRPWTRFQRTRPLPDNPRPFRRKRRAKTFRCGW